MAGADGMRTGTAEDVTEVFHTERRRLFGLAYRLLGSASDAEDVVQAAFEKCSIPNGAVVAVPAAWLTTVVTNLCLQELGSARRRRERYTGTWLPEPVLTSGEWLGPLETVEQRDSVSFAFLTLMERLTAAERAVYVLREAFGYRYADIAGVLGRPEATCRQLHRRAAKRLDEPVRRFQPDPGHWRQLTRQFLDAAAAGDVAGLERLLAEDAVSVTDGEGSGLPFARKPVAGRFRVAVFCARLHSKYAAYAPDVWSQLAEVNGQPALLAWRGQVLLAVIIPEFRGEEIAAVRLVASPAKLAFAARQAAGVTKSWPA